MHHHSETSRRFRPTPQRRLLPKERLIASRRLLLEHFKSGGRSYAMKLLSKKIEEKNRSMKLILFRLLRWVLKVMPLQAEAEVSVVFANKRHPPV